MDRRMLIRTAMAFGGSVVIPQDPVAGDVAVSIRRTAQLRAAYEAAETDALERLEAHAQTLWRHFHAATGTVDKARWGRGYADSAQYVALIQYKAGAYSPARWWAEEAQRTALKIGDPDLLGIALARRGLILVARRDADGAVALLDHARGLGLRPYAAAMVEEHYARALAARGAPGDVDEALRALDRAVDAADDAERRADPRAGWSEKISSTWFVYHRGDVLVRFRPEQADRTLLVAERLIPRSNKVTHAAIWIRRAEAQVGMGNLEPAAGLAARALEAIPVGTAARDVGRAAAVRGRIASAAPPRVVRGLDEMLARHRRVAGSTSYRADRR